MAGMFYSLQEAAEKLNKTEEQLKEIVQEGKLREFRDGSNLLFKIEDIEALMSEAEAVESEAQALEVIEPEVPEPEMPAPEAEEEAVEFDFAEPEAEAEEGTEVEFEIPEPEAEEPEAVELEVSEPEALEVETPEPEAEISEPEEPEEDISELQALSEDDVPSLSALEAELEEPEAEEPQAEDSMPEFPIAEMPEPEAPTPSESAADSDEILLAPETGASFMTNDLTDADTALTGLGTSVLGETDHDYAITDDTMAETAIPTGAGGTTPSVPLEEIEEDVNLDTFGSGSGLLDLSLQADDTSLGGILDEIYTAEDEGKELGEAEGDSAIAISAEADQMVSQDDLFSPQSTPEMVLARTMIEMAPDAQSNTLGMLLFLPLAVVIYTSIVAVSGLRGVMPSILGSVQAFIWYIMGGVAVVAGLVVVAAFIFTGERDTSAPKEKKPKEVKVKKEKKPKKPKEKKPKKPKIAKKGFLRLK